MFSHNKKSLDEKKAGSSMINNSGIYKCKITEAAFTKHDKSESLKFTLTDETGRSLKFCDIMFRNYEGEIDERGLEKIKDLCKITAVKLDGTDKTAKNLNDKEVILGLKVVAKKKGKSAGFPVARIYEIFTNNKKTVFEEHNKEEAVRYASLEATFAKDEPIVKDNTKSVEERIAEGGGKVEDEGFDPFA